MEEKKVISKSSDFTNNYLKYEVKQNISAIVSCTSVMDECAAEKYT